MLSDLKINKVLFLDIETVPMKYNFEDLSPEFQKLWEEKTVWLWLKRGWGNCISKKLVFV